MSNTEYHPQRAYILEELDTQRGDHNKGETALEIIETEFGGSSNLA